MARPRRVLLHAEQSLAPRRQADRRSATASPSRTSPAPITGWRMRARRISSKFDVVHLRQDPPFDMAYITTTHLLERIHPKTLVVNNPAAVRNAPEKVFVLDFLDLMPPTLVTRSPDAIKAFRDKHKDIVVKPLYGNGGAAVFRIPARRHQSQLADRAARHDLPRADHGAALSPRGARRRQAHHPGRRRDRRRHQSRAGAGRDALQSACRRQGRASHPDRPRQGDLRAARARAEKARADLRRHRRDRRLSHRDQRHLADRHQADRRSSADPTSPP